jgi:hypothetical protein
MRRRFHTYLVVTLAALGGGGLASALIAAPRGVAAPGGQSPATAQASAAKRARFTEMLVNDLKGSGFQVSRGYAGVWNLQNCDRYTFPIMGTCYGINPANPYVVPIVKSWKDEFVDPAMVNVLGKTRRGYSATHRFDPREAIVVFGKLPPPARYMGLQTWVWTKRWLTDDQPWNPSVHAEIQARAPTLFHYLFNLVPRDPSRVQSFSTLSNNINNVVIQRQSVAAFGQTRYFIITPDRGMDRAVRRSLARLGVSMKDVFTEPIPPAHPLGLGRAADDFVTMIRYLQPDNEQAGNAWLRSRPLTVLRVRAPRSSHRPQMPFGPFVADQRTATPEAAYAPDLNNLVAQVCQRWRQPCNPGVNVNPMTDLQLDLGDFGPQCRAIGMDCLGDGQDASYFFAAGVPLDPGWVYAVVSTLATKTGNATYVGLSANDMSKLKGVLNIPDTKLAGSAASYASTVSNTDKFFVHYFTRDCAAISSLTDGQCTTITTNMVPPPGTGNRGLFALAVRSYVRPGTARGPLSSEQLRPIVIRFAGP